MPPSQWILQSGVPISIERVATIRNSGVRSTPSLSGMSKLEAFFNIHRLVSRKN